MQIKEIGDKKNVSVKGKIIDKSGTRTFSRMGSQGRVAMAVLEDESGSIQLTLWDDEIDKIEVGDEVEVENGYVKEFRGDKQLSSGREGSIKKL
ncbi:MAG: SOSS complex subunit B family protein [Candidatus Woesearchaeota archaeon]